MDKRMVDYEDVDLLNPNNQNIIKKVKGYIYKVEVICNYSGGLIMDAEVTLDSLNRIQFDSNTFFPQNYDVRTQKFVYLDTGGFYLLNKKELNISQVNAKNTNGFYVRIYYMPL